ncbi:RNase H domain-containing protein [Trichonephila inaurata madagascariensis]|uniref:RNase H domain-containing protein n=1 Tax=Trichonephila inaurata madagascariensis TaxID=2747483 RepID=A0A8X6YX64_9ARAC|nr:RNase H domain-containing protein [Trichonephila inaurata madagascariensis]
MATANDMDLTQNGIINNVHITSLPSRFVITDEFIHDNQQSVRELINLRDSYAIWAKKLSIVPAISDEYTATSEELGSIHTALLAAKERMNLPLFWLPTSIEALDALIKKVEEQRAHLTPVDSTLKETVPSDTTLNSPSKRTLKNLRPKSDRKRLIDDDGTRRSFDTGPLRTSYASASNQRLKRDSPINCKRDFIDFNVDPSTPFIYITPIDSFNHVEFREELLTSTPKHSSHPELLRQLALEVINDIPDQA